MEHFQYARAQFPIIKKLMSPLIAAQGYELVEEHADKLVIRNTNIEIIFVQTDYRQEYIDSGFTILKYRKALRKRPIGYISIAEYFGFYTEEFDPAKEGGYGYFNQLSMHTDLNMEMSEDQLKWLQFLIVMFYAGPFFRFITKKDVIEMQKASIWRGTPADRRHKIKKPKFLEQIHRRRNK